MKALPIQKRALMKRAALINAAINEFSQVGFEASTAKSIATLAGVATGTFYQYFDNKNEILRVIATDRYSQLGDHIQWFEITNSELSEFALIDVFKRILESVYDFHAMNPDLHQVLEQRKTLDPQLAEIINLGQNVLYTRILFFVQSFNVNDAEIIANNLFAMGEGVVHRQVFETNNFNYQDVIKIGAEMMASYFIAIR